MSKPINIPKEYWLDVNNFDYTTFDYDDIRCIYNSPRSLIDDFEKVNGFKQYVRIVIEEYKRKYKNKRKINNDTENSYKSMFINATKSILYNLSFLNKKN